MKLNLFLKTVLFVSAAFFNVQISTAQVFYNNGADVFMNYGSIVQANGGAENANSGTLTNHGNLYVTNNGLSAGNLTLSGNAITQGNGKYFVEQDFINNASFTQNNSEVIMNSVSVNQLITGSQNTTFHKLTLASALTPGLPVVSLTLNTSADSLVNLTDRELATATDTFFVLNTDSSILRNTLTSGSEGFVSSINPGTLLRKTNTAKSYVFPVGSSVINKRYRPVEIAPDSAKPAEFTVRFVNHDANTDGFLLALNDGVQCFANDTFYHDIFRRSGTISADIKLYYIASIDGNWTGISQWRTTNTMWNDIGQATPGTSGLFSTLVHPSWAFAYPGEPYVLTVVKPGTSIICPTNVCTNNHLANFSAVSSVAGASYNWTVPGGSTLISGQGTNAVNVNWNSPGQYIYVQSTATINGNVCASNSKDSCTVSVLAPPMPVFTSTTDPLNLLDYFFTDQTVPTPSGVSWNFGDGSTSAQQNPEHMYATPGNYTVLLTASANGCSNTDTLNILVNFEEVLIVPNIFTPNNDGLNDEFFVTYKGIRDLSVVIYNRWGTKLFEGDKVNFKWNGKDPSGQPAVDGTYFYIIKATSYVDKKYDLPGTLLLLGNSK